MTAQQNDWKGYMARRHKGVTLTLRRAFISLLLVKIGHQGTVNEIRSQVPDTVNPKVLGMVPRTLAGVIEFVGWQTNENKQCHSRPIKLWRLVSKGAAEQWLKEHQ